MKAPCEGCTMDFDECCAMPVADHRDSRIAELEDALHAMIHVFDPAALAHPPESADVRRRLEKARAVLARVS